MRSYFDLDKISTSQPDDNEDVEQLERDARNREQVDGGDWRRVIAKEGEPPLRRGGGRSKSLNRVLRHARLSDFETELQQFAVDTWTRAAVRSIDVEVSR